MEENNRSQDPLNPNLEPTNPDTQNNMQNNRENTYWENSNQAQPNTPSGQWSNTDAGQPQTSQTPEQFYQYYQQQMNNNTGNQQYYTQPQYTQNNYGISQKPPKKKHRGALAALIVVLLLVFTAAGTAFAFRNTLSNTLAKMTKSPAEYYAFIEKDAIKEAVDEFTSNPVLSKDTPQSVHMTTDISFDRDSIDSMLQSASADMSLSDIENMLGIQFKNIGFDATVATDGDIINEIIGLRLNKTNLISAELFMKSTAEQIFLRVPELSKAYLSIASEDAVDIDLSGLEDFNSEKLAEMITRYSNIIIDDIGEVEKEEKAELTIDTLSTECTKLTVTIDRDVYVNMIKDVLKEAKNDQTILDLLPMLGISEDDYQNNIDDEIDNVKEYISDDFTFDMIVYVNSKGEIIGREFRSDEDDVTLGYAILTNGNKEEYKLYATDEAGDNVIAFEGNHVKDSKGAYTGDASIEFNLEDESISDVSIDISYEDLRTEKKDNHTYQYGTVTISSMDLMGLQIAMDYEVEDNIQKCKMDFQMGAVTIASAETSMEYLNDYDVTMPGNDAEVYDINDMEGYQATMDLEGYLTKLSEQLGIDLQGLMDSFNTGFDTYDY